MFPIFVTIITCCVLSSVQCVKPRDLRSNLSAVPLSQMPITHIVLANTTSSRYIYGRNFPSDGKVSSVEVLQDSHRENDDIEGRGKKGKFKVKKKYKKYLLPLLIAYKLKFFTLVPVIIAGLLLLTGSTGMAGFFFALFISVMALKSSGKY